MITSRKMTLKRKVMGAVAGLLVSLVFALPSMAADTQAAATSSVTAANTNPTMINTSNGPLVLSCFASVVENTITWTTSASGGTPSYSFNWTGQSGTQGNGGTWFQVTVPSNGTYTAIVTVTDAARDTASATCDGTVTSINNSTGSNPTPTSTPPGTEPVTTNNGPLTVSCFASVVENTITWTTSASGGNGPYSFIWTGQNGTSGNNGSWFEGTFNTNGTYNATVEAIDSQGATGTANCSGTVVANNGTTTIPPTQPGGVPPTIGNGPLNLSCFASVVGNTITWTTSASGGAGPYSFIWSGQSGQSGNNGSWFEGTFPTNGTYNASVEAIDSQGDTGTANCSGTVTDNNGTTTIPPTQPGGVPPTTGNGALSVSCFASVVGNTITWTTSGAGGSGPYSFIWSGQSGSSGNNGSWFSATFPSNGTYTASVEGIDSQGNIGTNSCSGTISANSST